MKYCDQESIAALFADLASSGVEWLLLRNTEDALPDRLPKGKDVDVLVRVQDRLVLKEYLKRHGDRTLIHPLRTDVRLYGVHDFEMYHSPHGVLLDINFEIVVRSPDKGQWIPLDQLVQDSAWKNRAIVSFAGQQVHTLGPEDQFVTTAARCIFDKRRFSRWHSEKLSSLLPACDEGEILTRLHLIFFKYSERLLQLIRAGSFGDIVDDYFSFSDY